MKRQQSDPRITEMFLEIRRYRTKILIALARVWRRLRSLRISLILIGATLRDALFHGRQHFEPSQPQNWKRILVIRLDALGDVILTTPLLRQLKSVAPDAKLTLVVQRRNRELVETSPFVHTLLCPAPTGSSWLFKGLRREIAVVRLYRAHLRGIKFDFAIQPRVGPDDFAANLLLKLVDARIKIKYKDSSLARPAKYIEDLAFRSSINLESPEPRHEAISNCEVLRPVCECVECPAPEVFLQRSDREFSDRLLSAMEPGSLVIALGFGAQAARRKWPISRWAETLNTLGKTWSRIHVLVFCAPQEEAEGQQLRALLTSASTLVSGAKIREVGAGLEAARLFIGTDSGLAHLSSTVGCPAVVISPHPSGGEPNHLNSPIRFRPYSDRAVVLQPSAPVPPCIDSCDSIETHCILQITPEDVVAQCEKMIRADSQGTRDLALPWLDKGEAGA